MFLSSDMVITGKKCSGFGQRLRQARQERALTGPDLATQLGVERSAIPHYERGSRFPSVPVLEKLAEILQVSLDWLLLGEHITHEEVRDKELASYFRRVDQLDSRERGLVKVFLDSILAREELEELKRAARKKDKAAA